MPLNYLELVNDVLVRLRETEVSSVSDSAYSKLIGKFVNDAKRQVEDAYNWNVLSETITVFTAPGLFNYVLTGVGTRFKVLDVINDDEDYFMKYASTHEMNNMFVNQGQTDRNAPMYYNFNGVSPDGDTQVDVYPIPDKTYILYFNLIKPQEALKKDSDILKVPSEPVIFLAYAKALLERGEDAGINSNEAYLLFKESLGDHIAIEANQYPDELVWVQS